jgi:hypothetical protein
MSDRNLIPYFLVLGPILLVGAYMNWPASDAIGLRGADALIKEADSLMPLLIVATLGTIMVLSGVYLLISGMMENASGMNKQLLSVASVLIIITMAFFIVGMGSNVTVINESGDDKVSAEEEAFTYADTDEQRDTQQNAFDTGNTVWSMSTVTWGLSLILIGLVSFMMKRPESVMEYVLPALMPVGTLFLSLPIINNPELFGMVFPVVLLVHLIIGGLMLGGKVAVPGTVAEASE